MVSIISSLSRCDHLMCIVFVSRRLNVAIGWKFRGSNPGLGDNFRTRPARPLDPTSLLYNGLCVIPGDKLAESWH